MTSKTESRGEAAGAGGGGGGVLAQSTQLSGPLRPIAVRNPWSEEDVGQESNLIQNYRLPPPWCPMLSAFLNLFFLNLKQLNLNSSQTSASSSVVWTVSCAGARKKSDSVRGSLGPAAGLW